MPIEEWKKNETTVFHVSMCPVKANAILSGQLWPHVLGNFVNFQKYLRDFCSIENFWTWFLIMCTYKSMPKRWKNQLYTLTRYTFRPLKWLQIQNGGYMPCSAAWNHMFRNNHCDRKNCVGCLHWVLIIGQFLSSNENWKSVYLNYEMHCWQKWLV